ncbi:MAG: helix-turn-helix domain-containing protein [Sphingobacteriia bacterium]|nr:helix-turn-helix domain-containing protein [Sphingobacteriia bacterium]
MRNLLRTYRKKTELSIEDVSRLLGMPDSSTLSRCERGYRKPNLEIIFTYHILFEVSVEKLFESEMKYTYARIALNIEPLIEDLMKQELTKKVEAKIEYLNSLKELIDKKL